MTTHRVTIRGRFGALDESSRAYLEQNVADHDIFESAYTREGTLTYDHRIDFFNLRYEIKGATTDDSAGDRGLAEAETFLATMGWPHRGLRVTVVNVSEVWNDAPE